MSKLPDDLDLALLRAENLAFEHKKTDLALFIERLRRDQDLVQVVVNGGVVNTVHGLPGSYEVLDYDTLDGNTVENMRNLYRAGTGRDMPEMPDEQVPSFVTAWFETQEWGEQRE